MGTNLSTHTNMIPCGTLACMEDVEVTGSCAARKCLGSHEITSHMTRESAHPVLLSSLQNTHKAMLGAFHTWC
ncbi:Hypothetical predicted protein [Pelobates cultripes]|uniref:Uncharacterized protein n=1 Tax=Pelobates cultripes TaxID=61616 RepID=A0AAD1RVX6_PELCU|nr:Hypothetical predicted protein [Pelobates cultripes]